MDTSSILLQLIPVFLRVLSGGTLAYWGIQLLKKRVIFVRPSRYALLLTMMCSPYIYFIASLSMGAYDTGSFLGYLDVLLLVILIGLIVWASRFAVAFNASEELVVTVVKTILSFYAFPCKEDTLPIDKFMRRTRFTIAEHGVSANIFVSNQTRSYKRRTTTICVNGHRKLLNRSAFYDLLENELARQYGDTDMLLGIGLFVSGVWMMSNALYRLF